MLSETSKGDLKKRVYEHVLKKATERQNRVLAEAANK